MNQPQIPGRDRLVAVTETLFDRIHELVHDLAEPEWDVRSLCPDWTVREALAHAVGVEDAMWGWEPTGDEPPPFDRAVALVEGAPGMTAAEFVARVDQILDGRRAELSALDDSTLGAACMTPVGEQSYGRFLAIRAFDLWVHERDVCIPLGRATDDGGAEAELALDEVHRSMGYIVGKRIGLPDQMTLRFDLTGPVERQISVAVDGRAGLVEHVADPDVVVTADSTAFVMLACGRIDPQEMIDAGRISWAGDEAWGEAAARRLRFTM